MQNEAAKKFIQYCNKHIKGDEKGEAQIFLDHFFMALGYEEGLKGAGASCEYRIRNEAKHSTSFADLVWKPRVLIEMKKREEDLSVHLQQATNYWMRLVPDRPQYVILCNFDDFWIYDFDKDVWQPQVKVAMNRLEELWQSFSFLFPQPQKPLFERDHRDITAEAADKVAFIYKSIVARKAVKPEDALRYVLQCIIAMFAEDVGLLPDKMFSRIVEECENEKQSSYDLIGGLFTAMNDAGITPAGRFKGVDYFNGGLFSKIVAIDLNDHELRLLDGAAFKNWQAVNPSIFGTIFEQALEQGGERHKLGAHYTHEVDIKKIVGPVIVEPWTQKIEAAETIEEHFTLLTELANFKVLDPACGSGNFLFIAFKEMKLLERKIMYNIREKFGKPAHAKQLFQFLQNYPYVNTRQFYGLDIKPFAVELAKVTLMVAKELSWLEASEDLDNKFKPLPLDNLDKNIICCDALLDKDGNPRKWPEADVIIGNPPYQSKNKMQEEFGAGYLNKLRAAYPKVPGRADFCVYWFYKAHQQLNQGSYAGLVGTNTIRQNYSREGSLDYIVNNGGTIINAVSSEPWSGEAAVHVSIACWKKGEDEAEKLLYTSDKKGKLELHRQQHINSSLTLNTDVVSAVELNANKKPKKVFQGQTHGNEGFLLSIIDAKQLLRKNKNYSQVIKPFLNGDEMIANFQSQPGRFVIDFAKHDLNSASTFKEVFKIIEKKVLPERQIKAEEQQKENEKILKANPKAKTNKHHINFFNQWWKLSYSREDMLEQITHLNRYAVCSQVSLRPIFEFISTDINPNAALMVFAFNDDYSFGVIQSCFHWEWWKAKCSTLEGRFRYTTDTVWDTFPWPQQPTEKQVAKVAQASKALRDARNKAMKEYVMTLRDLYRLLEQPGKNPIKDLHAALDKAVAEAYGFTGNLQNTDEILSFLLALNKSVHEKEENQEPVTKPGLPDYVKDKKKYVSDDCVRFEE